MNRFDLNFDESGGCPPPVRYFTVAQANRALVLVRRIADDIVHCYERLLELQEVVEAAQRRGRTQEGERAQEELLAAARKIQAYVEELEDLGVELKDWSLGVVDFPCLADGREVYLCWRPGEQQVEYWHELDAGSAGRRPISTLPAGAPAAVQS